MRSNGNLVVLEARRTIWTSKTLGHRGAWLAMRRNGSLVVYSAAGKKLWSSHTAPSLGDELIMQNDGNLVVYTRDGRPLWSIVTGWLGDATHLSQGWTLKRGQALWSVNRKLKAIMQSDGNLVVYQVGVKALWSTQTNGNPGAWATLQSDGSLVVYSAAGKALWSSGTGPSQHDHLVMQNDGNLVIYTGDGRALWSYGTGWLGTGSRLNQGWSLKPGQALWSDNHRFKAIMQSDGNFVVYQVGVKALWSTVTNGNPGAWLSFQSDGNLVVYSASGHALWSAGTAPSHGDQLVMQDDANLVIYQGSTALWDWGSGLLTVSAPWTPNGSASGFVDEHDFSDSDAGEWGIDVPLAAGTPVRAPQAGKIIAYQQWSYGDPCGIAWCPGRLLLQVTSSGAVIGFGHVNPVAGIGAGVPVSAGQEIATIACNHPGCPAPTDTGDGDHVEFMYDSTGSSYNTRAPYVPPSPVSQSSGCPQHATFSYAGTGANPCVALIDYMHGKAP